MENQPLMYHDLLWGIRRSIRYHERRRRFFETFNLTANAVALILGSATIIAVVTKLSQSLAVGLAATITLFSSLNLVIQTVQKAQRHHDLARRFIELEKMLVLVSPSEELIRKVKAERLTIEADEPPIYRVVDILCHNEQLKADGYDPTKVPHYEVSAMQKFFAPFFDFRADNIFPTKSSTT